MSSGSSKNIPAYCNTLNMISSIILKKSGVQPKFHEGHVIVLLTLLLSEEAIGRKKLSERLGIGETSVRSLIRRLIHADFIRVDRVAGALLTSKGRRVAEELSELISVKVLGKDYLNFGWNNIVLVVLNDIPPETTDVTIIRDKAIALNADAVLIAIVSNGEIVIPGIPQSNSLYKNIVSGLEKLLKEVSVKSSGATILYAAIRENEPLIVSGYRLGFRILKHYCLRRTYC